ncbi:MAG: malto-oligosyltrehalose synthase [Gammaproteobacteria bacterium]|nr:malto-oligosyltrehalose synthase [Gammaproteobacteria bacterium]MBU1644928.1 malto-oligosyltrehalose synthase [Gammaproteobacteria bacterium]MBU1971387.1 malto-oligosyltrehalose synthase [Gammaproteobacteria bacterium]
MTRPAPKQPDALAQLAARCGIAAEYSDIWGKRHATSDATRRSLLAAMHFPAAADPAANLAAMDEAEWRRPLPPVMVLRAGQALAVPLSLATPAIGQRHRWILTAEDGTTTTGEFLPAELPQLGGKRLGKTGFQRVELGLPPLDAPGYYRLEVEQPGQEVQALTAMTLVIAPSACYQPEAVSGDGRVWGPTVQLYGMRSRRNWGIGDFGDLRTLVDLTADSGGGMVGVSPLHALFPHDPGRASPYSPSSRDFVNVLYLDVEGVPEFAECEAARRLIGSDRFQARLRRLRAAEQVAYPDVAAAKREVLALLHRHFRDNHIAHDSDRARAFRRFREEGGEALERHARFEALQEQFHHADAGIWGWPAWPEEYRHPESPAVAAFAAEQPAAVEFFAWLQWLADEQLANLGLQSWRRGLGVGLYQDLALGVNPGGAEAWALQDTLAAGVYAGAPPDEFNLLGQDWGLPPFVPHRLREAAYAPFIDMLRANMRHCGALRIDHAMALTRVFWVPAGQPATEGAYVSYPLEDLLGIVALESRRNHCMVIGEDLGTVPEGFSERLAEAGVLSYRPFLFERTGDGGFKPPADYPHQALVAVSTHDLPTWRGFWKGSDLDLRASLQLFPTNEQRGRMVVERAQDRARILMALESANLLPTGASVHPVAVADMTPPFIAAIHAYLARTPAQVLAVQPEDIFGLVEQANLPGSRDEQHPNWRRRLPVDLEDWAADSRFTAVAEVLRRERGTAVIPHAEEPVAPRLAVIPRATYRLQFNRDFTFAQATALASYLAELGVSHCYASPYLRARPGSGHGYDIVDHAALNPEIGSPQDYEDFVAALKANGLGQILDVVPNHMGVMGADNAWWLDVLENGPASAWGAFFDIDWEPLNPGLKGKVLLPLLGDHYGTVLNRGELRLDFDAARGEFSLFYYQHRLPLDPATYPRIVGHRREHLAAALGEDDERYVELQTLLTTLGHLPARTEANPARMAERQRDKEVHKRHLAALAGACADIAHHIADNVAEFNGQPNDAASFDLLHELVQLQGYRLAFWRVASDEINYRRFFDINDLAALRMDEPAVFEATHRFVLDLLAQGKIEGLRIDHPDGLYDPGRYFRRLQQAAAGKPLAAGEPLPLYLVIEKILAEHERLPDDWPIHGATGYRFANLVNNLFVDSGAERRISRIYTDFSGAEGDFEELAYEAKKLIMHTALSSELNVLATRLARIAAASRDTCDYTLNGLRDALIEVVACFPVYRSYVANGRLSADDRRHIAWAVAVAKKKSPAADTGIHDFLQSVLTTDIARGRSASFRERVQAFAMKFQQFSSPVMAKGVEDTSFYRYHRLSSLNDVGGEPRRFGISVAAFHGATRERATRWPHNMLATSTHDSKRSEDVRARINVLSEMPAAWKLMLKRWNRLNRGRKREIDGVEAPSRNEEYLLYQTLIGTWPLDLPDEAALAFYRGRIEAYMIKALREAKEHSSWVNVNADYEAAMSGFVQGLLAPGEKNLFLADFVPVVQPIARHGLLNALSQTLVKLASPGVPDIYQGCELWQFNLVDPDNRQPVDFARRRELLAEVKALAAAPPEQWPQRLQPLLADMGDGRIKLYTHWQILALRARWPEVFRDGDYLPLQLRGELSVHACAFARRHEGRALIVVVPRLPARLLGDRHTLPVGPAVWQDTTLELPAALADFEWRNVLSGESHGAAGELMLGQLLGSFPVALLAAESPA